ncbi:MAG TPA: plasmid maintenance system killer protein [Candidatus Riflebacteria bacterium]|nr:plasmid maintenance system killer protein [Candidatus Riflebacteria bacterium]
MIISFLNQGTENIYDRKDSKAARQICPQQIWRIAQRKLDQLNALIKLESLRIPPGNFLERLKGSRKGQHSIRINDQYRICFVWAGEGAVNVEIADYH